MEVLKNCTGTTLSLNCTGRIESTTASILENEINMIPANITLLHIDLSGIEYVSSAGLRVFLMAQKKMSAQGKMKLTGVNKAVMQVFEMTKMTRVLTIE